jgi:hypothetical protein
MTPRMRWRLAAAAIAALGLAAAAAPATLHHNSGPATNAIVYHASGPASSGRSGHVLAVVYNWAQPDVFYYG